MSFLKRIVSTLLLYFWEGLCRTLGMAFGTVLGFLLGVALVIVAFEQLWPLAITLAELITLALKIILALL